MKKTKIDFIGIGAQKAGTTWLYRRLKELPDFSLLPIKELHYFDRSSEYPSPNTLEETYLLHRLKNKQWTKGVLIELYANKRNLSLVRWYMKYFFSNYSDNWYQSLFDSLPGLKGEITPSYSILKEAEIRRMYKVAPEAKLILMLRNPIDRAWSHYRFSLRKETTFDVNLLEINHIIDFINSDDQDLRSNYINTIENYSKVFPKNQILIGFYDAISENPAQLLNEIVHFIGGDKNNIPKCCNFSYRENASREIDIPVRIHDFLKEKYYLQLTQLATEYGGYCSKWHSDLYEGKCAEKNEILLPTIAIR